MNVLDTHTFLQMAAIDTAEREHNRKVDWEVINILVTEAIADGSLDRRDYDGPNGQELRSAKIVEVGFLSLEIDLNGVPNPGKLPWKEQIELEFLSERQ